MTFQNPDTLVRNMDSYFINRNDRIARLGMTINTFQNIPGLVGSWPMSGVQRSTGDARDFGHGGLDLTYNGNPTYNYFNDLVPYIDLDGIGGFLSRADETDLDILGTETVYDSSVRGLTMGGWFWIDDITGTPGLIGKSLNTGNQRSYLITSGASGDETPRMLVNSTGAAAGNITISASSTISASNWLFIVGRYMPSTELAIFVNNIKTINIISIPASLFNSTANFEIGAFNGGGNLLNGRVSFSFLSANSLSDAYINALFQQSRVLFGV